MIYITEYWNEKQAVLDDWNLTLLLERREARKEEGEAFVPYIFRRKPWERILIGF